MQARYKQYLGDAVYAAFDGFHIVLTTEDGTVNPTNVIYLDPQVWQALKRYVVWLGQQRQDGTLTTESE